MTSTFDEASLLKAA